MSGKYTEKLIHHAKESAADSLKTNSKKVIQKTTEATGDRNEIANRITKVSKCWLLNNSETITNEHHKKRYISPEERQKIIDDLALI